MNARAEQLPALVLSERDHQRLVSLLETEVAARQEVAADVLRRELDRAEVVAHDRVPSDVVTMGARVLYADSFGTRAEIVLVFPWDASADGRRVSILSPLGASLIGLRAGARFDWRSPSGRTHGITVLSVRPPDPE